MTEPQTIEATVTKMPKEAKTKGEIIITGTGTPVMTPMGMVQHALQNGATIEILGKLMDLQERWERNEAKKAFTHALAAFKSNAPDIMKNKTAGFTSQRTNQNVGYQYATLDQVCAAIAPALSKHGLSHTWTVEQGQGGIIKVTCVLTHEFGHSEIVSLQASPDQSGAKNNIQAIGSTVSYLERYTLLAATGLAARDMDDDGGANRPKRPSRDDYQAQETVVNTRLIAVPKGKGGKPDWTAWRKAMLAAMKAATTTDELGEITAANDVLLADCAEADPKGAATLATAIKRRRAQLAPKPFTYVDLDHATVSVADADEAAEKFLAVMSDAQRRGTDQLDALWEANSLSGQLRDAGREDLANELQAGYAELADRSKKPAAPEKAAGRPQTASGPQTPTEQPKASPAATAAPERPSLASFSPFKPGVKGTNEAWVRWADAFLVEFGATPASAIKAFLELWKRELTYVQAYSADLGNLWDKIDQTIKSKTAA